MAMPRVLTLIFILSVLILSCSSLKESEILNETDMAGNSIKIVRIRKADFPDVSHLSVNINIKAGSIILKNTNDPEELITAVWSAGEKQPLQVHHGISEGQLEIIVDNTAADTISDNPVDIIISISSGISLSSFTAENSGGLFFGRLLSSQIGSMLVTTGKGGIDLEMEKCSLSESLTLESDYGSSRLLLKETQVNGDLVFTAETDPENVEIWNRKEGSFICEINGSDIDGDVVINTTSGKSHISSEYSNYKGNIELNSTRGSLDFDIWDCSFGSSNSISGKSESGAMELAWAEHEKSDYDLEFDFDSGSGEMRLRFWSPYSFRRYKIDTDCPNSDIRIGQSGTFLIENQPGYYLSENYQDSAYDLNTVLVKTQSKDCYIKLSECLKLRRHCGDFLENAPEKLLGLPPMQD